MTVRINHQTSYANRVDRGPLGAVNTGLPSTRGYACTAEAYVATGRTAARVRSRSNDLQLPMCFVSTALYTLQQQQQL